MEMEWGDPDIFMRSKEIRIAGRLGHLISPTLYGADAFDDLGRPVEYKSTIGRVISAAYNGISVFPTWRQQLKYLKEEKIGKYVDHFYARFKDGEIVEIWQLGVEDVLEILIPKLKKRFESTKPRKDPRLGATITKKEIHKYGTRIL